MLKVNIKRLTATRGNIPQALQGLTADTLRNLQTALNPVPSVFKDVEFWNEVDATPPYDVTTHVLDGTESFTCNADTKTATVVRGIRAKTQEELDAERRARVPQTITKLQAMKQLKAIGKWDTVKAILAENEDINDEWMLSDNLNRSYPIVLQIAQALGFGEEELYILFIEANKL